MNLVNVIKDGIQFYCNRGTIENFIKEGKNGFNFDNINCSDFIVNAIKFQIVMLTYYINNLV